MLTRGRPRVGAPRWHHVQSPSKLQKVLKIRSRNPRLRRCSKSPFLARSPALGGWQSMRLLRDIGRLSSPLPDRPGYYQCNACPKQFTVMFGTVFERSGKKGLSASCAALTCGCPLWVKSGHSRTQRRSGRDTYLVLADSSIKPSRLGILIFGSDLASRVASFFTMPSTDRI
jgi:hypothetical protein